MVLWWIANAIGLLVVIPLVILLANRVMRPATEIRAYADDILVNGVAVTAALEPVPALAETRARVGEITGHAVRYVTALERMV